MRSTLFQNEEETILEAQRPVLVNGIEDLAMRSDLLDRALVVHLPSIAIARRRAEADYWREFSYCRPWLVGALVEAAATAQARLPHLRRLTRLPRLADFAKWGVAAEPAFGCAPGTFARRYVQHLQAIDQYALESSPLSQPLQNLASKGAWRGTATELLAALDRETPSSERRRPGWPGSATRLSGALRRLAPNLRSSGLHLEFKRGRTTARQRLIELRLL